MMTRSLCSCVQHKREITVKQRGPTHTHTQARSTLLYQCLWILEIVVFFCLNKTLTYAIAKRTPNNRSSWVIEIYRESSFNRRSTTNWLFIVLAVETRYLVYNTVLCSLRSSEAFVSPFHRWDGRGANKMDSFIGERGTRRKIDDCDKIYQTKHQIWNLVINCLK